MATTTLALGQANYALLDSLDNISNNVTSAKLDSQNVTETLNAKVRGGIISDVGIGVQSLYAFGNSSATDGVANIAALNVGDISRGLLFNDSDASGAGSGPASNANINFLKSTSADTIGLGAGNNRVNAASDLTASQISSLDGLDTVRIGGKADNSYVSLGAGSDQLTVGLSSTDFDADLGSGNDTALFQGSLTSDPLTVRSFPNGITDGSNIINMGDGDDRATFTGGISGGTAGSTGYEVQLGSGNDTAIFGGKSITDAVVLNTGVGSDSVVLGWQTTNSVLDLGWDSASASPLPPPTTPIPPMIPPTGSTPLPLPPGSLPAPPPSPISSPSLPPSGDTVVLGAGSFLSNSLIRSGQSTDLINFAGAVTDTALQLGSGNATVNVSGSVGFGLATAPNASSQPATTVWDFGSGDDDLIFSSISSLTDLGSGGAYINLGRGSDYLELSGLGVSDVGSIQFDLGNDGDIDTIVFGSGSAYNGITISNFGNSDILFIGQGKYGYSYEFLNEFANVYDLDSFRASNNVIWGQQPGAAEQAVMTLDPTQFVPADPIGTDLLMHETYNPLAPDSWATETGFVTQDQIDPLADPAQWSGASAPLTSSQDTQNFYYGPAT